MIVLTSANFEKEIKSGTVLLDFWAPWCGPCKILSPILEQLSTEMRDIKFCSIDIDDQSLISMKFSISTVPTIFLLKDGNIVASHMGIFSKERLRGWIRSFLSG